MLCAKNQPLRNWSSCYLVRAKSRLHFECERGIMVAGKQTSFCWWTGTYNPSEMQGTKTCRLASNDKTRKRCRT